MFIYLTIRNSIHEIGVLKTIQRLAFAPIAPWHQPKFAFHFESSWRNESIACGCRTPPQIVCKDCSAHQKVETSSWQSHCTRNS